MKNIKKLVSITVAGLMALSLAGCNLVEKTPEAIQSTVLAKIGNDKITKGQLDERMVPVIDSLKKQYGDDYLKNEQAKEAFKQQQTQNLDNMVSEKIFLQKAKDLKLVPEEAKLQEEVDAKLKEIKAMYGNDDAQFKEALKAANFTEDSVKVYLKDQVIMTKVLDDMFKDIKITDEAIQKYYDENKDQFTQKPGAKLAHILVKTEDEAKDIKNQLNKGAKFEDLAKKYGTDGTKDVGGDLGFIEYDTKDYDADFMKGAKDLKEGEISGPVKTQHGFHIIRATEIKTEPKVTELSAVKDDIKDYLTTKEKNDVYTKKLEEWKKELKVKMYSEKLDEVNK